MGFWVNIRLIRYPDVLLMAAEAANEKGLTGEAPGIWNKYAPMPAAHWQTCFRR